MDAAILESTLGGQVNLFVPTFGGALEGGVRRGNPWQNPCLSQSSVGRYFRGIG